MGHVGTSFVGGVICRLGVVVHGGWLMVVHGGSYMDVGIVVSSWVLFMS